MAKGQTLKYQLLGSVLAILFTGSCLIAPLSAHASEEISIPPKITEIYPNGPSSSELGAEFIELANLGAVEIDLSQYILKIKDKPSKAMNLSGTLAPQTYKSFITSFSLVNNGEVVQLEHSTQGIIEEVGYSSGAMEDQSWSYFLSGWELAPITKDAINHRYVEEVPEEEPELEDICPATPEIDSVIPPGYVLNETGLCIQELPPIINPEQCDIEISEISAQPNHGGQEYIEFHNVSNKVAYLKFCSVKVNTASEKTLPDVVVNPGEYHIYAVSSGTIKNSAGSVALIRTNGVSLLYSYPTTNNNQAVNFETGSLTGEITDQPTPGQPNEQNIIATQNEVSSDSFVDCGPGRYRSIETNRCRNIESSESTLTPCAADQERNPETNRCRKVASVDATLKPCEVGQERNPQTNRCRKVGSTDDLKPCDPGQERNPETNRCRKLASVVSGTPLEGVSKPAAINPFKYKTPVIIFVLLAAVGYGVYEYRTDLKNHYQKARESVRRFKQ